MEIKIISHSHEVVDSYLLEVDGAVYHYKEYLDDRGKLIDVDLTDEQGTFVDDEDMLNELANRLT